MCLLVHWLWVFGIGLRKNGETSLCLWWGWPGLEGCSQARPGVSSGVLISREWSSSLWFNCVGSCFISQHIEIILVWECKPTHPSFYQIFWPLCLNSLLIIWNTTHCHYTTQHSTANIHAFLSANQTLKTFLLVSVILTMLKIITWWVWLPELFVEGDTSNFGPKGSSWNLQSPKKTVDRVML